ncbi:MAG: hypothetical protein Q9222_005528 [Ikaeria aurantiellina]
MALLLCIWLGAGGRAQGSLLTIEEVGSLLDGKQSTRPDVDYALTPQPVPSNVKDEDTFHITTEEYLHALIGLIEELVSDLTSHKASLMDVQARLAVNSVTLGDYQKPLQISTFVKDVHAGFQILNLKNDALRRRSDSIKYNILVDIFYLKHSHRQAGMTEPTTSKREAADPDGDVDFVLAPNKESGSPSTIQVSSKVLSLASPVFRALFQPHFKEGLALSSFKPVQISLPEDNDDAMTWLCHALHHRSGLNHEPEIDICEQVACLCDKYRCTEALLPWSRTWSRAWRSAINVYGSKKSNLLRMMCMAYASDDQEQYWHSTRNVVRFSISKDYRDTEKLRNADDSVFRILPEDLIGM